MTQLTGQTQPTVLDSHTAARSLWCLADLYQLTKPRLSMMVVVTAYIGFAMGAGALGHTPWAGLTTAVVLVGVALSCMGASVFNQLYERDTDALMDRTVDRPLPAGRVGPIRAGAIGGALSIVGVGLLAVAANGLTASLGALTIISYTLVYTPLKRVSSLSTIVGAVPGALPPVMGYTAATGRLGVEAILLFGILFLWQLPHFLAIAWLYRRQYAAAGMAFLPVLDPGGTSTFRQILFGCLALVPLGLMPTMVGVSGMVYFWAALIAGLGFLAFGVALVIGQSRRHARAMFFASLVYLPAVFTMMWVDQVRTG